MSWLFTKTISPEMGLHVIHVWRTLADDPIDVTFFRGIPTALGDYSFVDPFGPANATLSFPQVTGHDGPASVPWMREFTNVDITWLPASPVQWHAGEQLIVNPLTGLKDLYLHEMNEAGVPYLPIWEGWFKTIQPSYNGTSVQCMGAAYQLDNYYAKPLYPLRPFSVEEMMSRYFDPRRRGLWTQPLEIDWTGWTHTYGAYEIAAQKKLGGVRFEPFALASGQKYTGYLTRNTGGWEKALTGYVQGQLSMMFAKPDARLDTGATPPETSWGTNITDGDQWTIDVLPGRRPVLKLRRQNAPVTLVAWYGQPGVEPQMTRDGGQAYNVFFGQGVGPDGSAWSGQRYIRNGNAAAWEPMFPIATKTEHGVTTDYPNSLYVGGGDLGVDAQGNIVNNDIDTNYDGYYANRERALGQTVVEKYVSDFPAGITPGKGTEIATGWVKRDEDPGWSGTITITADLRDPAGNIRSKWTIRQGDVLHLKDFYGTGEAEVRGTNVFHVANASHNREEGSVTITVDSKFRDLLTVEHAIAQGRDSLSAISALKVGQRSMLINDLAGPWNPRAGSGVMPTQSKDLWTTVETFPYADFTATAGNRPRNLFKNPWLPKPYGTGTGKNIHGLEDVNNPDAPWISLDHVTKDGETALYIPVHAGAKSTNQRWAFFPVIMANAGAIARSEFAMYDANGLLAEVEFHVSVYNVEVHAGDMPHDPATPDGHYSALWDGAFEPIARDGRPWPPGEGGWYTGTGKIYQGWGTFDRPCGYTPVTKASGVTPTGMTVDGSGWHFDLSGDPEYSKYSYANDDYAPQSKLIMWVAVYAHIPGFEGPGNEDHANAWTYFRGRFFRSVQIGTGS